MFRLFILLFQNETNEKHDDRQPNISICMHIVIIKKHNNFLLSYLSQVFFKYELLYPELKTNIGDEICYNQIYIDDFAL